MPRRAGVNAFGFAGINAHAVLEEHAASADGDAPGALRRWETEAILLSAPDRAGLIERVRELIDWLERNPRETLKDVAYTLNMPARASAGRRASGSGGLFARRSGRAPDRRAAAAGRPRVPRHPRRPRHLLLGRAALNAGAGGLAFLFPGEGSQYPGMLADLCFHFPEVRRLFDTADRIALDLGETVPPSEHLFGRCRRW